MICLKSVGIVANAVAVAMFDMVVSGPITLGFMIGNSQGIGLRQGSIALI